MTYSNDLLYTESHEWLKDNKDGTITIGITDHAQSQLGDIVFVDEVELDEEAEIGDTVTVIESVKAAADIYAPISGKIVAANEELESAPETINSDPHGEGWIFKVEASDVSELDKMMSAEAYQAFLAEQD